VSREVSVVKFKMPAAVVVNLRRNQIVVVHRRISVRKALRLGLYIEPQWIREP
jgi:hypothetical protein